MILNKLSTTNDTNITNDITRELDKFSSNKDDYSEGFFNSYIFRDVMNVRSNKFDLFIRIPGKTIGALTIIRETDSSLTIKEIKLNATNCPYEDLEKVNKAMEKFIGQKIDIDGIEMKN